MTPEDTGPEQFTDPEAAVARLEQLYQEGTDFLSGHFVKTLQGEAPKARYRAFYPEVRLTTTSHSQTDLPVLRPCRHAGQLCRDDHPP